MASGIDRQNQPETRRSDQAVLNRGFDEEFGVIAVEQLGYDGQNLVRQRADSSAVRYDPAGYIGYAAAGSATSDPVWQIVALDTTSGVIMTYADGDAAFDNVWDNRAGLAYS